MALGPTGQGKGLVGGRMVGFRTPAVQYGLLRLPTSLGFHLFTGKWHTTISHVSGVLSLVPRLCESVKVAGE